MENRSSESVFLLDGEELVGRSQNRILNLSLLVRPNSVLDIPVSCVESGQPLLRDTFEFSSSDRVLYSRVRASKSLHLTENMLKMKMRISDQDHLWDDIDQKNIAMGSGSRTHNMSVAYDLHREELSDFGAGFQTHDHQTGAVFCLNGKVTGLELFKYTDTCQEQMPKLISSYALDAINDRSGEEPVSTKTPSKKKAEKFLRRVRKAQVSLHDALGEGTDLRLKGKRLSGGALVVADEVIHLCAFRADDSHHGQRRQGSFRF